MAATDKMAILGIGSRCIEGSVLLPSTTTRPQDWAPTYNCRRASLLSHRRTQQCDGPSPASTSPTACRSFTPLLKRVAYLMLLHACWLCFGHHAVPAHTVTSDWLVTEKQTGDGWDAEHVTPRWNVGIPFNEHYNHAASKQTRALPSDHFQEKDRLFQRTTGRREPIANRDVAHNPFIYFGDPMRLYTFLETPATNAKQRPIILSCPEGYAVSIFDAHLGTKTGAEFEAKVRVRGMMQSQCKEGSQCVVFVDKVVKDAGFAASETLKAGFSCRPPIDGQRVEFLSSTGSVTKTLACPGLKKLQIGLSMKGRSVATDVDTTSQHARLCDGKDTCQITHQGSPDPNRVQAEITVYYKCQDVCELGECGWGSCTVDRQGKPICDCHAFAPVEDTSKAVERCTYDPCRFNPCGNYEESCLPDPKQTNPWERYKCTCRPGATLSSNGRRCIPDDKCKAGTSGCASNAFCHDVGATPICFCPPGFIGDGYGPSGCLEGAPATIAVK